MTNRMGGRRLGRHIWVYVTPCCLIPWDHLPSLPSASIDLSRPGEWGREVITGVWLELCGECLIIAWIPIGH